MSTIITSIQENVDLFEFDDKKVYLVGTAHVSSASADLVEEMIRKYRPDTVCIELCEPRFQSIQNPHRWQEMDLIQVIRNGKAYVLMSQLILASFQKKIAKKFGIEPGAEMYRAIKIADEISAKLEVIDREIRTTLKRAWASAGLWSLIKMTFSLIASMFVSKDISEEEIERLKQGDQLAAILAEFSAYLPGVKTTLIDERDLYMSAKIRVCPGQTILAVVGAGHVPGMKNVFDQKIDLAALEQIPPGRKSIQYISWSIPALFVALLAYGFFHSGAETTYNMAKAWVLATGALAALGTMLALAHPLTIISAFIAAPITTLNPTIAAGWVCALVEAYLRKPRVKDLENIAEDLSTFRGLWTNRACRILLIMAFANLGAMAGTFLAGFLISKQL